MSHEHRALGFRPPPGSLAAEAQSAAARHPEGDGTHLDDAVLREIALRDAERIKADRELNLGDVNVSALDKGECSRPRPFFLSTLRPFLSPPLPLLNIPSYYTFIYRYYLGRLSHSTLLSDLCFCP